jgi:hypothetical protein
MVDDNIQNEDALAAQNVLSKQRKHSFYFSTSDTFKFMAGIFMAASMAIILPLFATAAKTMTFGAALTSLATTAPVGIALLGVAAVTTAIAIGSQYIASRNYQSANFDALEVNAKHTAKYLVNEIKKENACIAEQEPKRRADGKSWVEATKVSTAEHTVRL